MTKKLFSVLLSLLLVISFAENTFAKELSAASYTVNQFINSYADAGMKEWGGFHALEEDPLYDSSLDLVGYDVRIFNGNTYGYAFVLIDSDGYYVAEASIETESPFRLNQAEVRIYAGPSNYYSLEEGNNRAISLISGEEVLLSSVRPLSMNLIAENKKTYNVKASNTGTLSMSNFETQLQSSGLNVYQHHLLWL